MSLSLPQISSFCRPQQKSLASNTVLCPSFTAIWLWIDPLPVCYCYGVKVAASEQRHQEAGFKNSSPKSIFCVQCLSLSKTVSVVLVIHVLFSVLVLVSIINTFPLFIISDIEFVSTCFDNLWSFMSWSSFAFFHIFFYCFPIFFFYRYLLFDVNVN